MKRILSMIFSLCLFCATGFAQHSKLVRQGEATQLHVDGKPFLILGGELGNSSAACFEYIEDIFPKLQRMGLNTVLVPAYWDLLEPEEGRFDFSLTDKVLSQARENDLKVVFLWFGAYKNSMSCYAPAWVKEDYRRFPRAHTRSGKPLEILSAFSENVVKADHKAFCEWLEHLAEADKDHGTVIMIQIENEIGMLEDARDYSSVANKAFNSDVPEQLTDFLSKNKGQLHPTILEHWERQGAPEKGSWSEIFGTELFADEAFTAWHYASYVEKLAQTAKSIYDVPLYVNAALNSRGRIPGDYPSGGPLAHLIDIWRCAAPTIDFLSPDIYDTGFKDWVAQYHRHNNPLFIPEIRRSTGNAAQAYYILGEHDAIGISPFAIEDANETEVEALAKGYSSLRELMPLITKYQGQGKMRGMLFNQEDKESIFRDHDLTIICRHFYTLPWDPRATDGSVWPDGAAILIKVSEYEYLLAGSGVVVEFALTSEKEQAREKQALGEDGFLMTGEGKRDKRAESKWKGSRIGIASVDRMKVNPDGSLSYYQRLNGDEDHQGRHVRISCDDYEILHIKLYKYQ